MRGPASHRADVAWVTPARFWWTVLVLLSLVCGWLVLHVPPLYVLGGLAALTGMVVLLYWPFLGILAYLVFEYARLPVMFPVLRPFELGKVIVIATLAAWALRTVASRAQRLAWDRIHWLLLFWFALALFSALVATEPVVARRGAVDLGKWVAIYFMIVSLVPSWAHWRWFTWVLLLLNFRLSQFQLRSYSLAYRSTSERWRDYYVTQGMGIGGTASWFGNATDFGAAMCVVAPLAWYLFAASRSRLLKVLALVMFLAFAASILRSGSRGAAVALFAMAALYWLKSPHKIPTGIGVAAATVVFWLAAPTAWQQRFDSAFDYGQDATASSRIRLWKAGTQMFLDHPVTGVGINNFGHHYTATGGEVVIAPHSIFVQAASELGAPGLVTLLFVLYLCFKRNHDTRQLCRAEHPASRHLKTMADALDLSLVGFIAAGAFLTILYYPHLFMILALTVALNKIARQQYVQAQAEASPSEPGAASVRSAQ